MLQISYLIKKPHFILTAGCVYLLFLILRYLMNNSSNTLCIHSIPDLDHLPILSEKFLIKESAKLLSNLPIEAWEKMKNVYPKMYYKNSSCARYPVIYNVLFDNAYWQILKSSNGTFYLYGAYYDERSLLEVPVVRILGMIDRIEPTVETYCQIWMDSQNEPLIVKSEKYKYIWHPKWGNQIQYTLQPYLISCPMPKEHYGKVPISVSLVENICDNSANNLRVIFNKPQEKKKKFAVCVKGLDFLYSDLSVKVVEWIELLYLLGADKIYFYKLQVHANISKVLNYYEKRGKVNVTRITLPGGQPNAPGIQNLYLSQKLATKRQHELIPYNDCFYKNMYSYDYIVLLDIDEVIIPVEDATWNNLMEKIEPLSLVNKPSRAASYNIRNAYFYDDIQRVNNWSHDIPSYMNMLHHLYRTKNFTEPGRAVKCFHNTQNVLILHNHFPLGCLGKDCSSFSVDTKFAILHHYRGDCTQNCDRNICEQIRNESVLDHTILRYKDALVKNTMTALYDMGFFDKNAILESKSYSNC